MDNNLPGAGGTHYDVVVVGYGLAGVCAAITAADRGARVLIVDRDVGGGSSTLSGGIVYAGGGTKQQQDAGHGDDSPEDMYKYLAQEIWGPGEYTYPSPVAQHDDSSLYIAENGYITEQTLKDFCEGSAERLAWLEQHGVKFEGSLVPYKTSYPTDRYYLYYSGNEMAWPYREHATPHPRGHRPVAKGLSSGQAMWTELHKSALKREIATKPFTRLEKLTRDVSGQTWNLSLRTVPEDGKAFAKLKQQSRYWYWMRWIPEMRSRVQERFETIWNASAVPETVSASSVILATGGFVFNQDMLASYAPQYAGIQPLGTPGDDGSGIRLGESIGGVACQMDRMSGWRHLCPPAAFLEGIVVDENGNRFINEDLYGGQFTEALVHRANGKGYLILDATIWGKAWRTFSEQTLAFQKVQALGILLLDHTKAPTLERLAEKLRLPAAGLAESVRVYNEGIISGSGDSFKKDLHLSSPIAQGPFYGVDVSVVTKKLQSLRPVVGITLGGLKVHGKSGLLLDTNNQVIPGVYAAGRTASGICSNNYVSGLSLADCVFSGIRAGKHATRASLPQDIS